MMRSRLQTVIKKFGRDSLLLNAVYIFGTTLATSIGGFIFWVLAANFFSEVTIGIASSVFAIEQFLSFASVFGFGLGLLRFLHDDEDPTGLINSLLVVVSTIAVILGVLFSIYGRFGSQNLVSAFSGILPILNIIILLVLMAVNIIVNAVFVARRESRYSLFNSVIMNMGRLIFLVILRKYDVQGIFGANSIGFLVSNLVGIWIFIPEVVEGYFIKVYFRFQRIKRMVFFSFGNYLSTIFIQMSRSFVIPMTAEILSEAQSAYAYMVWLLAAFVFAPGEAIGRSLLVEGVHEPKAVRRLIFRSAAVSVSVTLALAIICFLFSPLILSIFGPNYADQASTLFRIMLIASPVVVLNYVFFAYLQLAKRVLEIVVASGVLVVVSLGVPRLTLASGGLETIGYGWLAANLVLGVYFLMIAYNKIQFQGISADAFKK